jgi:hypothetical protein
MFASRARAYSNGKLFRCSTLGLAPGLTHIHKTRQERFVRDKNSILLGTFINYARKLFYSVGHGSHFNHFLSARLFAESGRLHLAPTMLGSDEKRGSLPGQSVNYRQTKFYGDKTLSITTLSLMTLSITTLSLTTFSIKTHRITKFNITINIMRHSAKWQCCYEECHLCLMSFMQSVTNKPNTLSAVMLNVFMQSVVKLSVVRLSVIRLRVVKLSVVRLHYAECR